MAPDCAAQAMQGVNKGALIGKWNRECFMARLIAMDMPRDEWSLGYRLDFTNIYNACFGRLFFAANGRIFSQ
jgi:hypothetical protein